MKRRRHPFSEQNVFCLTANDIRQYLTMPIERNQRIMIFEHLRECERCNLLYHDLSKLAASDRAIPALNNARPVVRPETFQLRTPSLVPKRIAAGQIWSTLPQPKDYQGREVISITSVGPIVMIFWPSAGKKSLDNIIRVIPISLDTDFAVKGEDLVLSKGSPLEGNILLTVWNESPMLAGNLDKYLGQVTEADLVAIQDIREGMVSGTKKHRRYDTGLKKWRCLEMKRTACLSAPVNISLIDEEETEPAFLPSRAAAALPVTVELYSYQMAADTAGTGINELHTTDLPMKTDLLSASLLQKRNEIWLRLQTKNKQPVEVFINGEKRELVTKKEGYPQECLLGNIDALPDLLHVKIVHIGEEHIFSMRMERKEQ